MQKVIKLQLALFFDSPQARPDNLMNPINNEMGNLFNAMPQILAIPLDAPHDIPRVQLRSENNRYNCNISVSRIDFIMNGMNDEDISNWDEISKDFLAKIKLYTQAVFNKTKIIRFGLVGTFYVSDKSSSSTLTKKYLKIDLSSAEELNLRFNKRNNVQNLTLNNITSINTVVAETKGVSEKGILIELDINNIPQDEPIKHKTLTQIIEKELLNFSPQNIKELLI